MNSLNISGEGTPLDGAATTCRRCSRTLDDLRRQQYLALCAPCEQKLTSQISLFGLIKWAVLIGAVASLVALIPVLLATPLPHGDYSIPGSRGRGPTVMNGNFVLLVKILGLATSVICFSLFFWISNKLNRMKSDLL